LSESRNHLEARREASREEGAAIKGLMVLSPSWSDNTGKPKGVLVQVKSGM